MLLTELKAIDLQFNEIATATSRVCVIESSDEQFVWEAIIFQTFLMKGEFEP